MFMDKEIKELQEAISKLKEEKGAVILAHYYQRREIQEVADYIGDSLELSRRAASLPVGVIVFCGVHFMAETAALLSPEKRVVLPDLEAGCPLADMATPEEVRLRREALGHPLVVCYVNTSAAVKGESYICCTSANAVEVVGKLPEEAAVLFLPDRNLGAYVKGFYPQRAIFLWPGYCPVHEGVEAEDILRLKELHPRAKVLVHPECKPSVVELADKVASTSGMVKYVRESGAGEFIVATEKGILHHLAKVYPEAKFYLASPRLECPDMKKITLEKCYKSLLTLEPRVQVPPSVRERARRAVERMLRL
ncbi:MAG TPA: quinolinate synthase NadA [Moorella mulderi]|nr:quinolinate synthase NadA [Moorella mulderi]